MKQIKTAYAYLRVSSRQQVADGVSIDSQKEGIKEYCRNNNIRLVDVFTDCPASANNFNRGGLVRMLGRNTVKPVEYIIATDVDRVSRDYGEYSNLKNQLSELGTHLLFINNPLSACIDEILKTTEMLYSRMRKKRCGCDSPCDCDCRNR